MEKIFKKEMVVAKAELPKEFIGLKKYQQEIIDATDPIQLVNATIKMAKALKLYKDLEKDFNDKVKSIKTNALAVKNEILALEQAIKDKVIETTKITSKTSYNHKTGEVKKKDSHNLPKGFFTFAREKTKLELDRVKVTELANELAPPNSIYEITTEVRKRVIDEKKLQEYILKNGFAGLPTTPKITKARVGIQYKNINTDAEKLLAGINEK